MFPTSDSDINVDQLMHEIRQTVALRQKMNPMQSLAAELPAIPHSNAGTGTPPLVLQPPFVPHPDNRYHVNDLLKYHGRDFVRNAYCAILKREPDDTGMHQCQTELAEGTLNKIDILARLAYSAEGQSAGVRVDGLKLPSLIRQIERTPLIGYVLRIAIGIARLPQLHRALRQYEHHHAAQQQHILNYSNRRYEELSSELSKVPSQLSSLATEIQQITDAQQQTIEWLNTQLQELASQHAERDNAVSIRLAEFEERAAVSEHLITLVGNFGDTVKTVNQNVFAQERRVSALLDAMQNLPREGLGENLASTLVEDKHHLFDALYAAFEDRFRGPYEEIKSRLRVYLPLLKDAKIREGVLDVGCGRGEWLELLKEEGIQGHGVDDNRLFVARCLQSGLEVIQSDALAYLGTLTDSSLSAITSFHVVEHLPFETLVKLLDEMIRTLRPGGALILETPNPENFMVGSHTFYADPTHRNPIPSPTLRFLLESRGLSRIEVMNLRPWDEARIPGDDELTKRFNEYFYSSPDYGIVGWKI